MLDQLQWWPQILQQETGVTDTCDLILNMGSSYDDHDDG